MKNRCACRHPILLVLCCPQSAPFQPSAVSEYFIAFGEARWRRRHCLGFAHLRRQKGATITAVVRDNRPRTPFFRPPARLSTPVVTLRIGCSATPDASTPSGGVSSNSFGERDSVDNGECGKSGAATACSGKVGIPFDHHLLCDEQSASCARITLESDGCLRKIKETGQLHTGPRFEPVIGHHTAA